MLFLRVVLSQLGFLIFLLIVAIYLYFFHSNPPFEVYSAQTDKESYVAGESIRISVDGNIRAQSPSVTEFHLRDTVEYTLTTLRSGAAPEGLIKADLPRFLIPLTIVPGEYYIHAESRFKVNFLATRVVQWRTNPFVITAPPPPEPVEPAVRIIEVPVYITQVVEIPVYIYIPVANTAPSVELAEFVPVAVAPSLAPIEEPAAPKLNGVVTVSTAPEPVSDAPSGPAPITPPPPPVVVSPPPPPPPAPIPPPPVPPPPAPIPSPPEPPTPTPKPEREERTFHHVTHDDPKKDRADAKEERKEAREERKEEKREEKKEKHEDRGHRK